MGSPSIYSSYSHTARNGRDVFTLLFEGRPYYGCVADDGWPTGPCPSAEKTIERVSAYEAGLEVSEAAPQQVSRIQLTRFKAWAHDRGRDGLVALAEAAMNDGLHTEAWMRVSAAFVDLYSTLPMTVTKAGGTRVRRAAGAASLTRSG